MRRRSIAASTCASAGCARSSATTRARRASSRPSMVKVMSLASSSNARDRFGVRNFSPGKCPNAFVANNLRNRGVAKTIMNDDCELVRRLIGGDSTGLRELYQRHGRALLRFSIAMCRSQQSAEDLVHDTFVAFLREPSLFDPAQGTVLGYLCGVLRHQISRHFRQRKRWVAMSPDDSMAPV